MKKVLSAIITLTMLLSMVSGTFVNASEDLIFFDSFEAGTSNWIYCSSVAVDAPQEIDTTGNLKFSKTFEDGSNNFRLRIPKHQIAAKFQKTRRAAEKIHCILQITLILLWQV